MEGDLLWFTSQTPSTVMAGPGFPQDPRTLHPGVPLGWQRPKYLSQYQLPPRWCISRELARRWRQYSNLGTLIGQVGIQPGL